LEAAPGTAPRLVKAALGLVRQRLAEQGIALVDSARANVTLTAKTSLGGDGVNVTFGASRRVGIAREVSSARGTSLEEALRSAMPSVVAAIGAAPIDRPPHLGSASTPALAHYREALDEFFGATIFDQEAFRRSAEAAIAADPTWPHAWALLLSG